jgi:carbamoylphosphate synthase large subunit
MVGAVGTGTAFGIINRLRIVWGKTIQIVGTDTNPKHLVTSSVFLDEFYQVSRADSESFLEEISSLIIEKKIDMYIPILNSEIVIAAQLSASKLFSNRVFWSSKVYGECTDKEFANDLLKNIAVPTPLTINKMEDIVTREEWFVKPRAGYGSIGAGKMKSTAIEAFGGNFLNEMLVQEICSDPEVTVDSFYDYRNDFSRAYCRERVEVKSGVCTKARLFSSIELSEIAIMIGKGIDQIGIITFQVMKRGNSWVVTDLNLRAGAGTSMTCTAGFDVINASFAARRNLDYFHFLPELPISSSILITRQYTDFVMARE